MVSCPRYDTKQPTGLMTFGFILRFNGEFNINIYFILLKEKPKKMIPWMHFFMNNNNIRKNILCEIIINVQNDNFDPKIILPSQVGAVEYTNCTSAEA